MSGEAPRRPGAGRAAPSARFPQRYLGARPGLQQPPATYASATSGTRGRCAGRARGPRAQGACHRRPDVIIGTDAATWLALREGELSGSRPSRSGACYARGNLDLAVGFEGMFRLPGGREPLLRIHDVPVGRQRISTLTMGSGPDVASHPRPGQQQGVLLRHRRGAEPRPPRARHRPAGLRLVQQADAGPLRRRASSPRHVLGVMDALGIERAHLVGNSLGGRVAIEVGLRAPGARALARRCCARRVAFVRRGLHPLVRLLRPELGLAARTPSVASGSRRSFWSMFADRDGHRPQRGRRGRRRVPAHLPLAAARGWPSCPRRGNVYLERPFGARRLLRAAGRSAPARAVRVGRRRLAHPAGLRAATWRRPCPAPSRSCSTPAGTCPRSSAPSRRSASCGASSRARRAGRPPRGPPGAAA